MDIELNTIHRWLSNQRSYMKNSCFEKRLKIAIYDTLNDHWLFNMHQMIIDFGFMIKYNVLDMILRFKDKYA